MSGLDGVTASCSMCRNEFVVKGNNVVCPHCEHDNARDQLTMLTGNGVAKAVFNPPEPETVGFSIGH